MIDLKRTRIVAKEDGVIKAENVDAYLEEAIKQKLLIMGRRTVKHAMEVLLKDAGDNCFLCCNSKSNVFYRNIGNLGLCGDTNALIADFKALTLADLKPRTKTEYVGVHNSEAIKGVMEGENYYCEDGEGSYVFLTMHCTLEHFCKAFKKVETEITWQDEVEQFISDNIHGAHSPYIDADGDDVLIDGRVPHDVFIKMCHLVASMTDKP